MIIFSGETAADVRPPHKYRQLILAALIPFAACALQWLFWPAVKPSIWIFFYPAVFFSSWVGGMQGGVASTVISTLLVWHYFMPIRHSLLLEQSEIDISLTIFFVMGILFSLAHELLRKATRKVFAALETANVDRERLEQWVNERTAKLVQTVDALRQSESKYRSTLDSMLEGCQIIGFNWSYSYLNKAAEQHGRRPAAELLGKNIKECWPGIAETELAALMERCMNARTTHRLDNEFTFPDGQKGWFRLIIQPVDEGIAIFSEDITDRKQAELALRKAHERLRSFVDANIVGIVIASPSGDIIEVNDYYLNMVGYSRADFEQGMVDWRAMTPAEWLPADEKALQELREHGACTSYEKEYEKRDGTRVSVFISAAILPESDSQIVAFTLDITERKHAEKELIASKTKLEAALSSSTDAVFISDVEGQFIEFNDAFATFHKFGSKEECARTFAEYPEIMDVFFANGDVAPLDQWAVSRALRGETATNAEYILCRKDTGETWVGNYSFAPIRNNDGEIVGSVVSARDITEHKKAEEMILKFNAELEERVRERTAQLEAMNRELDSFSYSVSHDLKAPLRGIEGYSQLLEKGYSDRLDEEGRLFIRNVRESTALMVQLIDDLYHYTRMERRALRSVSLDLQALVKAMVDERAYDIEQLGVQLHTEVPSVTVRADREGVAIALRNLLGNALKFSRDAKPPIVNIGARMEKDKVILSVSDNGIGFDMKFHDRIFEIFQRLQRAEEYSGTGIGLAMVRKAMDRMGGRVWAESSPGKGATFFLEIPT